MLNMTANYDEKVEECEGLEVLLGKARAQITECQKELVQLKEDLKDAKQDPKLISENKTLKYENQQMKKLLASIAR